MTAAHSEDDGAFKPIINTCSGAAIGRDNYGTINAPIDDTTKAILRKLAKEAPGLADVVRRALNEGIVPPGLIYALERAAWAINEDVALMLQGAANNINEDVALQLSMAAQEIKEGADTASHLMNDNLREIRGLVERLEETSTSLTEGQEAYGGDGVVYQLSQIAGDIKYHAETLDGVITLPPARTIVNWRPTFWAFLIGIVVGMALLALATRQ